MCDVNNFSENNSTPIATFTSILFIYFKHQVCPGEFREIKDADDSGKIYRPLIYIKILFKMLLF